MSDDEKPSPEELERWRRWFDGYVRALGENPVVQPASEGKRSACPCCRFLTLHERGGFEVCKVCFWEDDGQDDQDASVVRGGPNGALGLEQARRNFAVHGACDETFKRSVRAPLPEERGDVG